MIKERETTIHQFGLDFGQDKDTFYVEHRDYMKLADERNHFHRRMCEHANERDEIRIAERKKREQLESQISELGTWITMLGACAKLGPLCEMDNKSVLQEACEKLRQIENAATTALRTDECVTGMEKIQALLKL